MWIGQNAGFQKRLVQLAEIASKSSTLCPETVSACQLLLIVQAHAYALLYEPQPIAATVVQYNPLAPLAAKAEAWEMSFVVRAATF